MEYVNFCFTGEDNMLSVEMTLEDALEALRKERCFKVNLRNNNGSAIIVSRNVDYVFIPTQR